jgi:hypothetical protein
MQKMQLGIGFSKNKMWKWKVWGNRHNAVCAASPATSSPKKREPEEIQQFSLVGAMEERIVA